MTVRVLLVDDQALFREALAVLLDVRSEVEVVWGDSSKVREATGWSPEIPLRQTLADTLNYAREAVTGAART